jgi:hypothetical protein
MSIEPGLARAIRDDLAVLLKRFGATAAGGCP